MMTLHDFNVAIVVKTQTWPAVEEPVAAVVWDDETREVFSPPNRSAIEAALRCHFAALTALPVAEALAAFASASHPYGVLPATTVRASSMEQAARTALQTAMLVLV